MRPASDRLREWAEGVLGDHVRAHETATFCRWCETAYPCDARRGALMVLVALQSLDAAMEPMALHLMASHLPPETGEER